MNELKSNTSQNASVLGRIFEGLFRVETMALISGVIFFGALMLAWLFHFISNNHPKEAALVAIAALAVALAVWRQPKVAMLIVVFAGAVFGLAIVNGEALQLLP